MCRPYRSRRSTATKQDQYLLMCYAICSFRETDQLCIASLTPRSNVNQFLRAGIKSQVLPQLIGRPRANTVGTVVEIRLGGQGGHAGGMGMVLDNNGWGVVESVRNQLMLSPDNSPRHLDPINVREGPCRLICDTAEARSNSGDRALNWCMLECREAVRRPATVQRSGWFVAFRTL
jgi:hypothetical protein